MKRILIFTGILFSLISFSAYSTIINIPADYPTIQAGIDASSDGDTVLVQPGTYVENINFNGHNIVLGSLYLTTGDSSHISTTIIDGDSTGTVITLNSGENAGTAICGLTIQNGYAQNGGGIHCANGSSPLIKNLRLKNNYAQYRGGGIYCENNSEALITGSVIDSNYTGNEDPIINGGGGISCYNSNPIITRNSIRFNGAPSGGGIGCFNASATISNNTITQNTSFHEHFDCGGGGIACWDNSHAIITDNHIDQNTTLFGSGGGIYCSEYSIANIENNNIEFNTAINYFGGGIAATRHSDCNIIGNMVTNNTAGGGGGIAAFTNADAIISENTLSLNSAEFGAGIALHRSDPIVCYNIIFNNDAFFGPGGGIRGHFTDNDPLIFNNTIYGNTSTDIGTAVYLNGWIGWEFYNNICLGQGIAFAILDSSIQVTYCNVQGGYPGEGNIDCDPGFCDPDSGNFYLDIFSCCVGAGRDSLGNPDPNVNIGALGIGCNLSGICDYVVGDVNWSGGFNGLDVIYSVNYFKGGPLPLFVCECTPGNIWYVCGDVNGSCTFNGLDVTTMVNYLKGGSPLINCPDCPPVLDKIRRQS